jgi:hypothetical protein
MRPYSRTVRSGINTGFVVSAAQLYFGKIVDSTLSTMISGKVTAPTHPSQATDDPTDPMYNFQDEYWEETPDLFDSELGKTADNSLREITANKKYREIDDAAMWNRYVAFGFHQFEDCISFSAKWKRATENNDPLDFARNDNSEPPMEDF